MPFTNHVKLPCGCSVYSMDVVTGFRVILDEEAAFEIEWPDGTPNSQKIVEVVAHKDRRVNGYSMHHGMEIKLLFPGIGINLTLGDTAYFYTNEADPFWIGFRHAVD